MHYLLQCMGECRFPRAGGTVQKYDLARQHCTMLTQIRKK
jgi:hypothetical protein